MDAYDCSSMNINQQSWYSAINNSSRLETYSLLKHDFIFEPYLDYTSKKMESTRQKNKILILSNIICLSMCIVVPVLEVRISTVNKELISQD